MERDGSSSMERERFSRANSLRLLALLDRAESIEGRKAPIDQLRKLTDVLEKAGYVALTPGWPDDPETVAEANANPATFARKGVGGGFPLSGVLSTDALTRRAAGRGGLDDVLPCIRSAEGHEVSSPGSAPCHE